ncbi:MAG TPA: hypothetical protein PKD83_13240, partial [Ignavibacteria bacterium]|nr:hypothetical protein [Ignavibacteria bacterium]
KHIEEYIIENYPEFAESEKYNKEKAAIGFYITGHPLTKYEKDINSFIDMTFGEDPSEIDFAKVKSATFCGVINDLQVKISKKGNKFVVFNLVDFYGSGECIAFSRLYEGKIKIFENDNLVVVKGVPEENGDKIKLMVDEMYSIDAFLEMFTKNVTLNINEHSTEISKITQIRDLVENSPGNSNLFFRVVNGSDPKTFKSREFKIKASKELISNLKNIVGENNLRLN